MRRDKHGNVDPLESIKHEATLAHQWGDGVFVSDSLLVNAPDLLAQANALLAALYREYPEKLPFYCRDAADRLREACDKSEGR